MEARESLESLQQLYEVGWGKIVACLGMHGSEDLDDKARDTRLTRLKSLSSPLQAIPLVPGVLGQGLVPAKAACLQDDGISVLSSEKIWS